MFNEIKLAFSENKIAIVSAVVILFASLFMGYFLQPQLHGFLNPVVEQFSDNVESGVIKLTFTSIFSNNIKIVFLMFLTGFIFCFSALILSFNGLFTGYFIASYDNLIKAILYIVPHGIFEFSSIILACASGFVAFHFIVRFLKTLIMQENCSFKERIGMSFNANLIKLEQAIILLMIASVLMLIAGVTEVYLTKPIADFILAGLS